MRQKKIQTLCFVLKCEACPQFSGSKETRLMQFVHFRDSTSYVESLRGRELQIHDKLTYEAVAECVWGEQER